MTIGEKFPIHAAEITTERLVLRRFTDADTDAVFALRSDPEIMRFIRTPQHDRDLTKQWISLISNKFADEGIGFFAVVFRETAEVIGWCGLWKLRETNEVEIGYAIAKKFWKRGFASEASEAVINYGFLTLNLEKIVAVADPKNQASQNVMRRLGMTYDYAGEFYGRELVHYSLTSQDWKSKYSENGQ